MSVGRISVNSASIWGLAASFVMLVALSCTAVAQDDVQLAINPPKVLVGEPAEMRIVSLLGFVNVVELPVVPGLKWLSDTPDQGRRVVVLNTKRTETFDTVYKFTVNREGEFTIPEMRVEAGHVIKKTAPLSFTAFKQKIDVPDGKSTDLEDLLYISLVLLNPREEIYIGEEVELEIRMYSLRGLPVSCSWPVVDVDKIVLRNYGRLNPEAPSFLPPVRRTVKLEEQLFNVDIFKTAYRAISTGTPSGKITIPCVLKLPRESRRRGGDPFEDVFRDSFFASYRTINHNLVAELPERKVIPLPAAPENSHFLGLVGEWDINFELSSLNMKAGAPETLRIIVSGTGTMETLTPPALVLPGFRMYPPEIKKSDPSSDGKGQVQISYAMIPRAGGPVEFALNFCTFSPSEGKYKQADFFQDIVIGEGERAVSSLVVEGHGEQPRADRESADSRSHVRDSIVYLKLKEHGGVQLPIYKNRFFTILLFFILGPVFFAAYEFTSFRVGKLRADPLLRRKNSARRRKRKIILKLDETEPAELHHLIQSDITPFLNDLLGYPPGTSATELAEKVDDPDLADCLRSGSVSSFMPQAAHEDPGALKKKLGEALKCLSLVLVGLLFLASTAAIASSGSSLFGTAREAYDNGRFETAENQFRELLSPRTPDPATLYNIGNCLYQQGKLPEALVFYEKARRLNPSDSDTVENLNYIRRNLGLPEVGTTQNPIQALKSFRDSIRPDLWLLIAAVSWSLAWISIVARRVLATRKWVSSFACFAALFLITVSTYLSQMGSTYGPRHGIVVKKDVQVYLLPATTSRKIDFDLYPGAEVSIEEERHNWSRIRDERSEGWVSSDTIEKLWPY